MIGAKIIGDLQKLFADDARRVGDVGNDAVELGGVRLKLALRRETRSGGLGDRVANLWGSKFYRNDGKPTGAAALVYARDKGIIGGHVEAQTIRPRNGKYIALPTGAAGLIAGTRKARYPAQLEKAGIDLRFVPGRGGRPPLLVADNLSTRARNTGFRRASKTGLRTGRGLVSVAVFVLLKSVRTKKRIDVDGPMTEAEQLMFNHLTTNLVR